MLRRIYTAYLKSFKGLSRETWLLSLVMLINRAGTMAVPFMTMYATQSLGWSLKHAGLLITMFGVGGIGGAFTGGYLVDKIGFRPVQIIAACITALLFFLFPFVKSFYALMILTICLAFAAEAFRPANYTAIASYAAPGTMTRSYTLNRLAINIGWAAGVALGGLIASLNYNWLFWFDAGGNMAASLLILLLLPATVTIKRSAENGIESEKTTPATRKPWHDAYFLKFITLTVLFNTCFFLVFRLVPVYWKTSWLLNERNIGLVMGLNGVVIALFEMTLVSRLDGKRPAIHYIIYGCVASALGYLVLLLPGFTPMLLAIAHMLFLTLGEMLAMPFMNSIIMERSTPANRGQYAAAYTLSWSVAQICGPAGGALIADGYSYGALWIVLLMICLLAAAGFYKLGSSTRSLAQ